MLIAHPHGHYHFLQGIDPYSCGVIADPGYEIVHVTLSRALPWREGFDRIDAHLKAENWAARSNATHLSHDAIRPPSEPVLHAFSYVVVNDQIDRQTLIVAGAGELREGILVTEGLIRPGDTSPESMREKATYVMQVMDQRLKGLGGDWDLINEVNVYTIFPLEGILEDILLPTMGPAHRHGIRWYYTRPPVVDIDFEMDLHGVVRERLI